jgi:hypothetical protein
MDRFRKVQFLRFFSSCRYRSGKPRLTFLRLTTFSVVVLVQLAKARLLLESALLFLVRFLGCSCSWQARSSLPGSPARI